MLQKGVDVVWGGGVKGWIHGLPSPNGATSTLIIKRANQKVGTEANFQHSFF